MVTKRNKWAIVAGTVLIGLAGTLVVCTESSKKPRSEGREQPPPQMEREKPNRPPDAPPFMEEEQMPRPPETYKELEEFLERFDPERLEELKRLKEVEPERFERLTRETKMEVMKLKELRKQDPQRYEQVLVERTMERATKDLADEYRKAQNDDDKENLKKEIRAKLERLFDLRETQREAEIKRVEQELTKLKEKMKIRKTNRDKIIERRQKQLLGEADEDDMGW